MADTDKPPSNGDTRGQTFEQVSDAAERGIRNLVGIPVSLREFEEMRDNQLARDIELLRAEFIKTLEARERELRRSIDDIERLRSQEKDSDRHLIDRVEVDLRRQFDQIREQVDQRDVASKEAVTKAEQAATTAISAAAATTQTAVTKAETAASNAIIQAAEATRSAVDGVKEIFDQQIGYLRERFDVYTSQHKEVHDSEHIAADKFEKQSAEWARALTEFRGASERAAESFVKRDTLDDMRRGLEQQIGAMQDALNKTSGREGASTQYAGILLSVLLALMAVGVSVAIALTR